MMMANWRSIMGRLNPMRLVSHIRNIADAVAHFERVRGQNTTGSRPARPYQQIAPVRAAVSTKAKALASMPLLLSTADDRLIESGPLWELVDKPNPRQSSVDFWQTTSAWLDLSGAVHWVFPNMIGRRPTEIVPVSAWQMKPILDASKSLSGWRYTPAGKTEQESIMLSLDQVWTVGEDSFDPAHPYGYSSPLEPAAMAIAQLWKSDITNEASLDNAVEPGGAFVMPGKPSDDQLKDMRRELSERHAGPGNRRRPMLLWGGMDWQQIAASFSEMEFTTLQKMKIVDVCVALGVDPAAIGYIEGGRFEFVKAAKSSMWIDVILPRAAWLADEFDRGIVSRFVGDASLSTRNAMAAARAVTVRQRSSSGYVTGRARTSANRPLFSWFDSSSVPAVREATLSRSREGAIWIQSYKATPADVIEVLDLPLPIHPWQEIGWQAIGEMPVDEARPGDEDADGTPPPPQEGPDETTGEGEGEEDAGGERQAAAGRDCRRDPQPTTLALAPAVLEALWGNWRASWSMLEKQVASRVRTHWVRLRRDVLRKLSERVPEIPKVSDGSTYTTTAVAEMLQRDVIADVLFSLVEANGRLRASIGPLMRRAIQLGGQQAMDEAAAAEAREEPTLFNMRDPLIEPALRARNLKISGMNQTVRRRLAEQLGEGLGQQETVSQLAERVRHEFNLASNRSATIARTEVGAAVEEARQLGRQQANVPMKSWLWSRRETGRPWHMATEEATMAEPVLNDQDFTIAQTGARTPHPRGPGLDAIDAVNCGCTTLARYPGDKIAEARLFTHLSSRGFLRAEDLATQPHEARPEAASAHRP